MTTGKVWTQESRKEGGRSAIGSGPFCFERLLMVFERYRDKNGDLSHRHAWQYLNPQRHCGSITATIFAAGCAFNNEKLSDVLHKLDELSLERAGTRPRNHPGGWRKFADRRLRVVLASRGEVVCPLAAKLASGPDLNEPKLESRRTRRLVRKATAPRSAKVLSVAGTRVSHQAFYSR